MTSWREFWNKPNRAYVNAQHTAQHYKALVQDIVEVAGDGNGRILLDFGCGEAGGTTGLVAQEFNVLLHEQSTHYREAARKRYGDLLGVSVLADGGLAALEADSIDLLLVCSVLQYVPKDDVADLVEQWRTLLKPGGLLIVADITTARSGPVTEAFSLLWSGLRNGYFLSGFASLVALVFSDYQKTRQSLRLSVYSPDEVLALLAPGFEAAQAPKNFGLNSFRVTVLGRKRDGS